MSHPSAQQARRAEEAVADVLREISLPRESTVLANASIGQVETDFLLSGPGTPTIVIDVKAGLAASRLTSLAHVARIRDHLQRELGTPVTPILVAIGPDSQDLEEAGADFGVCVVAGESTETLGRSLRAALAAAGALPPPATSAPASG
jgi:hypothetical protein